MQMLSVTYRVLCRLSAWRESQASLAILVVLTQHEPQRGLCGELLNACQRLMDRKGLGER